MCPAAVSSSARSPVASSARSREWRKNDLRMSNFLRQMAESAYSAGVIVMVCPAAAEASLKAAADGYFRGGGISFSPPAVMPPVAVSQFIVSSGVVWSGA